MPGATGVYGFPYAVTGDPPDGPSQQQAMMEAVEDEFVRLDTQPLIQVYTSNSTWNKPANAKYVEVEVQGGGGGGGGCLNASGQGEGGGAGGGGYALRRWAASALGSSVTVTVGAGGTGGSPSSGIGGTGGTSTFNGVSGVGGVGGAQGTCTTGSSGAAGGTGGSASGGDYNQAGQDGSHGRILVGATAVSGRGGSSVKGFGAPALLITGDGAAGKFYGGGGGGAFVTTVNRSGGTGGQGIVIVRTWF